jgi:hypothetical protein
MASKESNTIRFVVGSKEDIHSSVWRLWATGNDLYLAARSHAHISKIRFHQSGINRFATNQNVERKDDAADRVLHKWKRAKEVVPGWTEGFGILVPPRMTQQPFGQAFRGEKSVHFVKPPEQNSKVIFKIVLSHKAARPEHVERLLSHKITIHERVEMKEEFAWLVSFYDTFAPQEHALVADYFNKVKIHLKPGNREESIYDAFLHVLEMGEPPFLIDIQLGRENLDIAPQVIEPP